MNVIKKSVTTQEALILLAAGKIIFTSEKDVYEISIHKGAFWVGQEYGLETIMYLNDYDLFARQKDYTEIIEPIKSKFSDLYD